MQETLDSVNVLDSFVTFADLELGRWLETIAAFDWFSGRLWLGYNY